MIDFFETWIGDLSGADKRFIDSALRQAEASLAGSALRSLRSRSQRITPRRWTGRIGHGRRGFVGQTVVLPDRTLGRLIAARRGWACVAWVDPFAVRSRRITYSEAASVQPFRHPAAATLGARKRGVTECPSARKANAARKNGRCPVRRGSRPRGRPRVKGASSSVS